MRWLSYFSLLFTICTFQLQGAAAATHVYFAQMWMDANSSPKAKEEQLFFAGNLFADIRYLGTLKRDETHEKKVTAKKIRKTKSPFKAGMRLHAFADVRREKFVEKSKVLNKLTMVPKKYQVLFMKLLEDEILWEKIKTIDAQLALLPIYPEELDAGVDYDIAKEWHNQLIDYFHEKPSKFFKRRLSAGQSFLYVDKETLEEWTRLLPQLASDPYFQNYCNKMTASLKKDFKK